MKREDMVCLNCNNYEHYNCKLNPKPFYKQNPHVDWCGQGQWSEYELYGEGAGCAAVGKTIRNWGEWDD